jgi:fructan beta-fructosidase
VLPLILSIAMTTQTSTEALRPQYHFTAPKGWLNDPNGLVYFKGEYHLFYQHNPHGTEWGNMTWGHAVSKDLLTWKDLPHALEPDATGTMFSGSAVVDINGSAGAGKGAMVLFYTAAGGTNDASKGVRFTQGLATSLDGRSFKKFGANPIVAHIEHENRDPKVLWHEPSKSWVMALYINDDRYSIFRSPDLRKWTKSGDLKVPGGSECPDFFELPVFGAPGTKKWVFWAANGKYLIGSFDGHQFKSESGPHDSIFGENDYAAQTYSDEPIGRRIQISWMRGGKYPGMPFNQQMTLPRELKLRQTPNGIRLWMQPVKEMESLRAKKLVDARRVILQDPIATGTELLEVRLDFRRDRDAKVTFAGQTIAYTAADKKLTCGARSATLPGISRYVDLAVYFDRTSIELFADDGLVQIANCFVPDSAARELKVEIPEDMVIGLKVWELRGSMVR